MGYNLIMIGFMVGALGVGIGWGVVESDWTEYNHEGFFRALMVGLPAAGALLVLLGYWLRRKEDEDGDD